MTIDIHVIGEDSATGIDEIFVNTENTSGIREGIHDLQGRKLTKVPANGMCIMNGKKCVK